LIKSLRIIDADVHSQIDPKRIEKRLPQPFRTRWEAGNRGPGHLGYYNPNGVMRADAVLSDGRRAESSPDALAQAYLDPRGIEYVVLNEAGALSQCVAVDADYSAMICSAINDEHAENWLNVDPRILASVVIPGTDPALSAAEIRRVGGMRFNGQRGFVQIYMSSAARMPLGQRFYWPIYEAAEENGLAIGLHPGMEGVGISYPPPGGYPARYIDWHTGLCASFIAALISFISEGVFQKFPRLKLVLMEGGVSWLPGVLWRFDKNWKALRAQTPWLDRLPSEIAADHVRLTTQPLEEPAKREDLHRMLQMFPAEKMLMFSSDFPHWDGDTPEYVLKWMPENLKERVMSETARETYQLPRRQAAQRSPAAAMGTFVPRGAAVDDE
jgi:predicted TIM-barrel fold metal-dependent hydrolase